MPTFGTLVKFTAQEVTEMSHRRRALEEGIKMANEMGIKIINTYAISGPYDVILIYEAKDRQTADKLATDFGGRWGGHPETWALEPVGRS